MNPNHDASEFPSTPSGERVRVGKGASESPSHNSFQWRLFTILAISLIATTVSLHAAQQSPAIDFNRDIRPIFAENCYACHGPDQSKRKGGLRLDQRGEAFKKVDSGAIPIVAGHSDQSELIRRITTTVDDDRMPPAKTGKHLSQTQIDVLRRWVDQGAEWKGHWSYLKAERPPLPEIKNRAWPRNEIDHFIVARLDKEGLKPSLEADKRTLARRVTLDLTGLPPSVDEVEQYLYDNSAEAYEKLVDRLLKSPHYGERMAQFWLDLARYADSQGYHHDRHRDLWHWRDWVIDAFNKNMPFDQFTIEQVAGDLLPNATREQRVATGFNRNEMTTSEGGADPNEYAVKYVVGRVDTTARVWLGTSLACAECHDHKYDPISQKEFYQFFAYFNTVAENGMDASDNPVPRLMLDTPEQKAKVDQFGKDIAALEAAERSLLEAPNSEQDAAQLAWQHKHRQTGLMNWTALEPVRLLSKGGATLTKLPGLSISSAGVLPDKDTYEIAFETQDENITGLRLEVLPAEPHRKAGRSDKGDFVLTGFDAKARALHPEKIPAPAKAPSLSSWHAISFKAASAKEAFSKAFEPEAGVDLKKTYGNGKAKWDEHAEWADGETHTLAGENTANYLFRTITVDEPRLNFLSIGSTAGLQVWWNGRKLLSKIVARATAVSESRVLVRLGRGENKLLVKISSEAKDSSFDFKLLSDPVYEHPIEFGAAAADYNQKDFHVRGTLDDKADTGWAVGGDDTQAGKPHFAFYRAQDSFGFKEGSEITVRLRFESQLPRHLLAQFRVAVTTSDGLTALFDLPDNIRSVLLAHPEPTTAAQNMEVQKYYRTTYVPEVQQLTRVLVEQRKAKDDFINNIPVTMVMQEMEKPRDTFLLVRGNFQAKGDKVSPGIPQNIFPMPAGLPSNRLGLAKWLVHPDHPLTSRVTINHFWQQYFGIGLVKTAEDFGSQGELPSHPELLDWLATEFIRTKWDIKKMQRLIVTSATYRQSSQVTSELLQRDPDDRLLTRFPRLRMEAEAIRDVAMGVSGLLNLKVGGPSAYPYQPPGLWEVVAFEGSRKYVQSAGDENYRRGLYTYWRRSIPYPSFVAFDAPTRETCTVKRPRTNTPLQALVLMNDPVYVEAARALGQRIVSEGGGTLESRLNFAFRLCLARPPSKMERETLEQAFRKHLETYEHDRVGAAKLINVGAAPPPVEMDICELAAWTVIANTLLNLDETITKG